MKSISRLQRTFRLIVPRIPVILVAALIVTRATCEAAPIVVWDWNDGTTQGWSGSSTSSNVANTFRADNNMNGSLQMFGPMLPADTLTNMSTVSFDLTILSYTGIASPADLTLARLNLTHSDPFDPNGLIRFWVLDLSGLAFGQTRTFNLSILDAMSTGSLANPLFFNLIFADSNFNSNVSSGTLDNFVVSSTDASAVPESASVLLLGTGLVVVAAAGARRRIRRP